MHEPSTRNLSLPHSIYPAALAISLITFMLYSQTVYPGVGPSLDGIELQSAVLMHGVIHPTGSPQYLLLGEAAIRVLPGASPAYRLNVFSAVTTALAAGVLFLLTHRLIYSIRRQWAALVIGAITALSFAVAQRVWYLASTTEVYALNTLWLALVLYFLVTWHQTRQRAAFWLATAAYALSFGNHLSMITILPAYLWMVIVTEPGMLLKPRNFALVAGIVLIGASQYLLIAVRVADGIPPLCNFCPADGDFLEYLTGGPFKSAFFGVAAADARVRIAESMHQFGAQFLPWGIALGVIGLWEMIKAQTRLAMFFVLALLLEYAFVIGYAVPDWHDFLSPSYVVFAPLIGLGLMRVYEAIMGAVTMGTGRSSAAAQWMAAGMALIALGTLAATAYHHWIIVDQSEETDLEVNGRLLLRDAAPGAWLLMAHPNSTAYHYGWAIRYLAFEEQTPDFSVVTPPQISFTHGPEPYYYHWNTVRHLLTPAALAETPRQLFILDPDDARFVNYGMLPLCRPDEPVIVGYEVIAVRVNGKLIPLVTETEWKIARPWLIFVGDDAECPGEQINVH